MPITIELYLAHLNFIIINKNSVIKLLLKYVSFRP